MTRCGFLGNTLPSFFLGAGLMTIVPPIGPPLGPANVVNVLTTNPLTGAAMDSRFALAAVC